MNKDLAHKYQDIINIYKDNLESYDRFQQRIRIFFEGRSLTHVVHSVRFRMKDIDHLLEKIERKNIEDEQREIANKKGEINKENLFERVTDIAGVRVLHLYLSQFPIIHSAIMNEIAQEEFVLHEPPKAYTWDPESEVFFQNLGIKTEKKDSFYTSIHYVLKPNSKTIATCEVQVRTLLEEVWGEIDHTMNYPTPVTDEHCREQIRVLARLVGAGSHLSDSIMKRYGKTNC